MVKYILFFFTLLLVAGGCTQTESITGGVDSMAFISGVTWAHKEVGTHTKLNTMTANDDDLDSRVKLCMLAGANSTGITRMASGSVSGSLSVASSADISVSFATDCDGGDPDFDASPKVVVSIQPDSGFERLIVLITNVSDSGFTARVITADGTNQTATFHVIFHAIGYID